MTLAEGNPGVVAVDSVPLGERFDLFQRYSVSAMLLDKALGGGRAEILEVGANVHGALGRLLPNARIVSLDIELPPELASQDDFVLGDARSMDFPDDSFDAVVAIDVLEHVPSEDREKVISEMVRVSRGPVLLAFPNADNGTRDNETLVNGLHSAIHGEDHRWLKEHLEYGCPSATEISDLLTNDFGLSVTHVPSGYLPWWTFMMMAETAYKGRREMTAWLDTLHYYYNRHIAPHDRVEPAYRAVLLASTSEVESLPTSDFRTGEEHFALIREWVAAASAVNHRVGLGTMNRVSRRLDEYIAAAEKRNVGLLNAAVRDVREALGSRLDGIQTASKDIGALGRNVERALDGVEQIRRRVSSLAEANASAFAALHRSFEERWREAYDAKRLADEAAKDLRNQLRAAQRDLVQARKKLEEIQRSESYRVGRFVTAPIRALVRAARAWRR